MCSYGWVLIPLVLSLLLSSLSVATYLNTTEKGGGNIPLTFVITNPEDYEQRIKIYFMGEDPSKNWAFIKINQSVFTQYEVEVLPKTKKEVVVFINIPKNAECREYNFNVVFESSRFKKSSLVRLVVGKIDVMGSIISLLTTDVNPFKKLGVKIPLWVVVGVFLLTILIININSRGGKGA